MFSSINSISSHFSPIFANQWEYYEEKTIIKKNMKKENDAEQAEISSEWHQIEE